MKDIIVLKLFINGFQIEMVDQYCYLGVQLSDDCSHDIAFEKERKSLYSRINKLIRLFCHCTEEVKIRLFTAYCTSFYCASLWCSFKDRRAICFCNGYRSAVGGTRFLPWLVGWLVLLAFTNSLC